MGMTGNCVFVFMPNFSKNWKEKLLRSPWTREREGYHCLLILWQILTSHNPWKSRVVQRLWWQRTLCPVSTTVSESCVGNVTSSSSRTTTIDSISRLTSTTHSVSESEPLHPSVYLYKIVLELWLNRLQKQSHEHMIYGLYQVRSGTKVVLSLTGLTVSRATARTNFAVSNMITIFQDNEMLYHNISVFCFFVVLTHLRFSKFRKDSAVQQGLFFSSQLDFSAKLLVGEGDRGKMTLNVTNTVEICWNEWDFLPHHAFSRTNRVYHFDCHVNNTLWCVFIVNLKRWLSQIFLWNGKFENMWFEIRFRTGRLPVLSVEGHLSSKCWKFLWSPWSFPCPAAPVGKPAVFSVSCFSFNIHQNKTSREPRGKQCHDKTMVSINPT